MVKSKCSWSEYSLPLAVIGNEASLSRSRRRCQEPVRIEERLMQAGCALTLDSVPQDLYRHKPQARLLHCATLALMSHAGEFLTVVRPSGCGKSTFLQIRGRPDASYQRHPSRSMESQSPNHRTGSSISSSNILARSCCGEPWSRTSSLRSRARSKRSASTRRAFCMRVLEMVASGQIRRPLSMRQPFRRDAAAGGGSHGRSQLNAQVLLLDEPFSSVDALTRGEPAFELILGLWEKSRVHRGCWVTHDVDEAVLLSDRIAISPRDHQASWR